MAEDIDLAGKAEAPKRFKGDGNEAEQHSLADLSFTPQNLHSP